MPSILCVDDEPAFLELTKNYLGRSGEYVIDLADSAETALDKLGTNEYDTIVCDYQMPSMDGLELLKLLREQGDKTPFIVFTGKGREEVAIEALNLGADFYIQKGGETKALFAELSNMVGQLVGRRVTELALADSEERYRSIFHNCGSPMLAVDAEGRILLVNVEFEELTGMKKEDLEGKPWQVFVDESSANMVAHNFATRKVKPEKAPDSYEMWVKRSDGTKRLVIAKPRFLPSMNMMFSPLTDITAIRETERNLERLNRMYMFLSQVNQSIVRSASIQELYPRICEVAVEYGGFDLAWIGAIDPTSNVLIPQAWAPADSMDVTRIHIPLDGAASGTGSLAAAIADGKLIIRSSRSSLGRDVHLPDSVRSLGYSSLAAIPLRRRGQIIGSMNLYSRQPDYFSEYDVDLLNEVANDISFAITGFDIEADLSQKTANLANRMNELRCLYTISEMSYQEDLKVDDACEVIIASLTAALWKSAKPSIRIVIGDSVFSSDQFSESADRISAEVDVYGASLGRLDVFFPSDDASDMSLLQDEISLVEAVARKIGGIMTHITMRQELKAERDIAQKYLDIINVMIVVIDKDGMVSLVNNKACEVLGYEQSEILGKNWFENFLPKESMVNVQKIFSAIIEKDIERYREVVDRIVTKNGETREILWHNTFVTDGSGQVTHTISSGQVVSHVKKLTDDS